VRTLYAIVSELGVSLDEMIFADGAGGRRAPQRTESEGPVQRAADRPVIELESGVRWERLGAWKDMDIEYLYAIYEVGGESSPADALVRHNGREFGVVLEGRLNVTVGFDEHVLDAGDSISFDSSTPHRLHNESEEVVQAIWVVVGRGRAFSSS
jgi:mannose-6-phosphate isomerase-like protein (cupin superfamily)